MLRRIFYCNITYGCNSNCVFCYSHNTWHNGVSHNEISIDTYIDYLRKNEVGVGDRVIINGGEPLIHSKIQELLDELVIMQCEVLIYTNGRLLNELNLESFTENYRFVVPIHGYKELHDEITGVDGSYIETLRGLQSIIDSRCKVDIKVILNSKMVVKEEFGKTLESLKDVPFNHAVHLTKMADTIISKKNNCISVTNSLAARYTKELYEYFKGKYKVKIFDNCIKDIYDFNPVDIVKKSFDVEVYFKDKNQEFKLTLEKSYLGCMKTCEKCEYCHSAVGEYTVLEIFDNNAYVELE